MIITLPRWRGLRGPGLAWLPAVWRQRALWRTVGRIAWLGPLVGGAPYVIFIVPIPFAYGIGLVPAVLAGLAFASWYHASAGRAPGWLWRAVAGALSAGLAVAAVGLWELWQQGPRGTLFMTTVVALHGVPAGIVLALLQRPGAQAPYAQRKLANDD